MACQESRRRCAVEGEEYLLGRGKDAKRKENFEQKSENSAVSAEEMTQVESKFWYTGVIKSGPLWGEYSEHDSKELWGEAGQEVRLRPGIEHHA